MTFEDLNQLKRLYEQKKSEFKKEMEELRRFGREASKDDLFAEMAYCICTPQSRYENCQAAIDEMTKNHMLFSGGEDIISYFLRKNNVRFYNKKAKYIKQARERFYDIGCEQDIRALVDKLLVMPQREARHYLLFNVKIAGLGVKESSHFLRNIGHGSDLALLDTHVLKTLQQFGVVEEWAPSLSYKKYLEIEAAMKRWADEIGIPLGELDLLIWSQATGVIF